MADANQKDLESFLDLPDDELTSYSPDTFTAAAPVEEVASVDGAEVEVEQEATVDEDAAVAAEASQEEAAVEQETPTEQEDPAEQIEVTKATTPEKQEESAVDYKTEYERLLAPFKANGRDISVKGVDDAITLMQMGANYNKKMAALKPNLKLLNFIRTKKI